MPEAKPRWTIKDSVFQSLFRDPESRLDLYRTIHPDDTNVTVDDIEDATLQHVFMNDLYNDLAMLVKNRLVIFIEAQSAWTYAILLRLVLYWAIFMQEYISDNKLDLHHITEEDMPEPEFYVVYTGGGHTDIETLSLGKDFFKNPDCSADLTVKIIHTEDKSNLLGQYIIFCHVYKEQYKLHGRSKKTIEETIRICKDSDVLKSFLAEHEKEVIDMVDVLFDPERQHKMDERNARIQGVVEAYKGLGQTPEATAKWIATKFGFSQALSRHYVEYFWDYDPRDRAFAL